MWIWPGVGVDAGEVAQPLLSLQSQAPRLLGIGGALGLAEPGVDRPEQPGRVLGGLRLRLGLLLRLDGQQPLAGLLGVAGEQEQQLLRPHLHLRAGVVRVPSLRAQQLGHPSELPLDEVEPQPVLLGVLSTSTTWTFGSGSRSPTSSAVLNSP